MSITSDTVSLGVLGAVALGVVLYIKYQGVPDALDPTSSNNLAYKGVNNLGAALTGDPNFDLGSSIYDGTHGGAIDVTSSNNLAAKSTNGVMGWLTGDPNFELGSKIYDWTH